MSADNPIKTVWDDLNEAVPRINGFRVSWDEFLAKQKAINDTHDKVVDLSPAEYSAKDSA